MKHALHTSWTTVKPLLLGLALAGASAPGLASFDRTTFDQTRQLAKLDQLVEPVPIASGQALVPTESNLKLGSVTGGNARALDTALVDLKDALEAAGFTPSRSAWQGLIAAFQFEPESLAGVRGAWQQLAAQHLLYQEKQRTERAELLASGISDSVLARFDAAFDRYEAFITPVLAPLNQLFIQTPGGESVNAVSGVDLYHRLQRAIGIVRTLEKTPVRILRNSTLPYAARELSIAALPESSSAITPSYLAQERIASTPADSASSNQTPLNDAVLAKAKDLEYDPIQIVQFVQQEIDTEWYAGLMKGPEGTLQQQSGNSDDQAALLVALLRAAQIPTRYVQGVIRVPVDQLANQLGIADTNLVMGAVRRAGISSEPVVEGGQITAVKLFATWVSAEVPYANYRGATVDDSGKSWLPLMPFIKRYEGDLPTGALRDSGFTVDSVREQYFTERQSEDVVSKVRSALETHLQTTGDDAFVDEQFGNWQIVSEDLGYLPNSLPVAVDYVSYEGAELPQASVHQVRFQAFSGDDSESVLDVRVPLMTLASQRVTLSYQPYDQEDHTLALFYGGLNRVPLYLINLRAQIKVNGLPLKVGEGQLAGGEAHRFDAQLITPVGEFTTTQNLVAGGYHALGLVAQNAVLDNDALFAADTESAGASLLSQFALNYASDWNHAESELAAAMGRRVIRPLPTLVLAGRDDELHTVMGLPEALVPRGLNLDAAFRATESVAAIDNAFSSEDFTELAALQGSWLEHAVFSAYLAVDGISADKGLAIAAENGIPVATVNSDNADVSTLQHPVEVLQDVARWVQAGFTVRIPQTAITDNDWTGSVWVVDDPATGSAGYFIARSLERSLAGGANSGPMPDGFEYPSPGTSTDDGAQAAVVNVLQNSNHAIKPAGGFSGLAVQVTTASGGLVINTEVIFAVTSGGGEFATGSTTTARTDLNGIATVFFRHPQELTQNRSYLELNPDDDYVTEVARSYVEASLQGLFTTIKADQPFSLVTTPGPAAKIELAEDVSVAVGYRGSMYGELGPNFVRVVDQFDNPVANHQVQLTTGAVTFRGGGSGTIIDTHQIGPRPDFSDSKTLTTNSFGRIPVHIRFGRTSAPADFPIIANSPVGEVQLPFFAVDETGAQFYSSDAYRAVKAGEEHEVTGHLGVEFFPESNETIQVDQITALYDEENPVSTGTALAGTVGDITSISTIDDPKFYTYEVDTTVTDFGDTFERIRRFPNKLKTAGIVITPQFSGSIQLEDDNTATPGQLVRYQSEPDTYRPLTATLEIKEGDDVIFREAFTPTSGSTLSEGALNFPPVLLSPQASYSAQIIFNQGCAECEVRSDEFPVTTIGGVFINVVPGGDLAGGTGDLSTGNTKAAIRGQGVADTLNGQYATVDAAARIDPDNLPQNPNGNMAKLGFRLQQPADVRVVLHPDSASSVEALPVGRLSAGDHTLELNAVEGSSSDVRLLLGERSSAPVALGVNEANRFRLEATSVAAGNVERLDGEFSLAVRDVTELPVSHAQYADVNLFKGSLSLSREDISVTGRGPELMIKRSYSSQEYTPGGFGAGWSHSYESFLERTNDGWMYVKGGLSGASFYPDGDGGFTPGLGFHGSLAFNVDANGWDVTTTEGMRYHYAQQFSAYANRYYLSFIEDPNGRVLSLGYNPALGYAQIEVVSDDSGREISFEYGPPLDETATDEPISSFGGYAVRPVIKAITGLGYEWRYRYDRFGRLVEAIQIDSDSDATASQRSERYEYTDIDLELTGAQLLADQSLLRTAMTALIDPNGVRTTYTHTLPTQFLTGGYNNVAIGVRKPLVTRQQKGGIEGHEIRYAYQGHLEGVAAGTQLRIVTDERGQTLTYEMDEIGRTVRATSPAGTRRSTWIENDVVKATDTDENGVTTTYTYDQYANVLTETVDGFAPIENTYFVAAANEPELRIKNLLATRTDRNGNTTSYTYNQRGDIIEIRYPDGSQERMDYYPNGDLRNHWDRRGNRRTHHYDDYGNIAETRYPIGAPKRMTYDERSRKTSETDENGHRTRFEYDGFDRLVRIVDAEGGDKAMTWDANNNKLTETDEAGREQSWRYDYDNRMIEARVNGSCATPLPGPCNLVRTFTYDDGDKLLSETDARGNTTDYTYDGAGRQVSATHPAASGGTRQVDHTYDFVGNRLTTTVSGAQGSRLTRFDYDNLYRVTRTTNPEGGILRQDYDDNGNVTREVDELGRITRHDYDSMDRRTRTVQADGTAVSRTLRWQYDDNGNITRITDGKGFSETRDYDARDRLIRQVNAEGEKTSFRYDAVGNLVEELDDYGRGMKYRYDRLNRRVEMTDRLGFTTRYDFDPVGNPVAEHWPNGNTLVRTFDPLLYLPTEERDDIGLIVRNRYDENGNRIETEDGSGNTSTFTFDAMNQLTNEIHPEGRVIDSIFDVFGNAVSRTDGRGNITQFTYDDLDRLTVETDALGHETRHAYDAVGNRTSTIDARGNTTQYTLDALNREISRTDPAIAGQGNVLTTQYDANDNPIEVVDKRGIVTTSTFDKVNRVITQTRDNIRVLTNTYDEVGHLIGVEDALGNRTAYEVNARGERLVESKPLAAITRFSYDAMGNRIETIDPEGRTSTYTYDGRNRMVSETNGAGETTSYVFDLANNQTRKTRPLGNQWQYAYDSLNRLASIEDANGAVSSFEYDGANNTTAQIDALGRRTEYDYSVRNERVLKRYPTVASITVEETSTYDEASNRIGFVDGNGASHTYTYDALNRLTDLTYAPGAGSAAVNNAPGEVGSILTEHREYDANNNLTRTREVYATATAEEERSSARTYDRFDRLLTTTDTFGHTTGYQYDLNGNRVQLTDSDGIVTRSRFDALNRTVSVSTTFGETQYRYDRSSRQTGITYPNGTQGVMSYDQAGRQLEMVYSQGSATVLRYLYRYDENGNRVEQVEENGTDEEVTQYGYDANDRLETIGYNLTGCSQVPNCTDGTPEESVIYTYDAIYNRLSEQVRDGANTLTEDKTYTYNARNQMTRIDDSVSGDVITYIYDGRGARIRKDKTANNVTESERYIRDVRGHLRETIKDAVTTGKYVYDWQGLRVEKIGERGVERSVYDDQSVLQHKDQTGITIAKWDYGSGQLLSMKPQGEPVQMYLTDSLGSVAALTNESGAVQKRTSYDAWGMKRREVGSSYNRFGFTGYEEDRETGLYYAKARYYDPDGIFLSQDAWEGDPNIAPSLHKYLYVYQNPTVFIDPTGNMPVNPSSARREDENGNVSYSDRNVLLNQLDNQQETVREEQAKANAHAAAEEAKREEKQAKAAEHINEQRETAERNQAAVNGELAEFNRETRRLNNQFSDGKQTSVREFQQTFGRQSTKKEIVEDGLASTAVPAEIAEYDQSIRGYSRNLNQSGLNAANVGFETLRAFDPTDPFNLAASATGPVGLAVVGTVKGVRGARKAQNVIEQAGNTNEKGRSFDRDAVIKGFQDHHIISDKNSLTKDHALIDLAGENLQRRSNKIFLPTDEALHPSRSIHKGRHTTEVSRNLARKMDQVVQIGRQEGWSQEQYKQAFDAILAKERKLLKSGERALNKNARPWAK